MAIRSTDASALAEPQTRPHRQAVFPGRPAEQFAVGGVRLYTAESTDSVTSPPQRGRDGNTAMTDQDLPRGFPHGSTGVRHRTRTVGFSPHANPLRPGHHGSRQASDPERRGAPTHRDDRRDQRHRDLPRLDRNRGGADHGRASAHHADGPDPGQLPRRGPARSARRRRPADCDLPRRRPDHRGVGPPGPTSRSYPSRPSAK